MKKHSVVIMGHSTSISLESVFWDELKKIAIDKKTSLTSLIQEVDYNRTENLSSALRLFVLKNLTQKIPVDKNTK